MTKRAKKHDFRTVPSDPRSRTLSTIATHRDFKAMSGQSHSTCSNNNGTGRVPCSDVGLGAVVNPELHLLWKVHRLLCLSEMLAEQQRC